MGNGEIIHADCLEHLRSMPDASIDSLVTDPPAGISFMGKSWDDDKGGRDEWVKWLSEVMRECRRVLKPGAHALVWGLPRTSHWTANAIEDAGFEIRDKIYHAQGQGFPKSLNVSKAIDKARGLERKRIPGGQGGANSVLGERKTGEAISDEAIRWQGFGTALKPSVEEWILCRTPLAEKTVAANVIRWGCGALAIDACRIKSGPCDSSASGASRSSIENQATIQPIAASDAMDKQGTEGSITHSDLKTRPDTFDSSIGTIQKENIATSLNTDLSGNPLTGKHPLDTSSTIETRSKQITGLKTSNSCDAPTTSECTQGTQINTPKNQPQGITPNVGDPETHGTKKSTQSVSANVGTNLGRWPSNCVLSHNPDCDGTCTDLCPVAMLDAQAGQNVSRYFYSAKVSPSERNAGLDERKPEVTTDGRAKPIDNPFLRGETERRNSHPTVKPLKLMRYLIRLITPPGGTVLDPFAGSGSTGVAAVQEGFKFIGIEREAEYVEIARARLRHAIS